MLAALVVATACSSGDGDEPSPSTSAPTDTTAAPQAAVTSPPAPTIPGVGLASDLPPPPDLLEIVYRVERVATGVVDTEHRLVRRPFEVRIETHRGEPVEVDLDADPTVLDVAVLGGAETGGVDQDRLLVVVPPVASLRGSHLRTDVAAADAAGVLEPLGYGRKISGRSCAELRTGAGLDGGILRRPTETGHNDVCVDDDGLVLREEITTGGAVIERRTAVSVDTSPELEPDELATAFAPLGYRIPEDAGGGRVRRLTPDSRPPGVAHYELASPPPGTELLGRFGVLTDSVAGANAAGPTSAVLSIVDVYVGGGEVVTIENGAALLGGPVLGRGEVEVPLPFAPQATAVFLTSGIEVRAPLPTDRFVRMTTTLPLERTVELARSLQAVEGPGQVVPLDDEPDVTGRLERPT